jgi:hypothetical protein
MVHKAGVVVQTLWNASNLLSLGRLVTTVPLATHWGLLALAPLFAVMAITETIDGRLARRYGWWLMLGTVLLTIYSGYDYWCNAAPLFRI